MEAQNASLVVAGDRIRETAKWLTVSIAALGAILIAGTQFSSVGSLSPEGPRFTAAIWGGLLAATGTFVVLWATVWTATTKSLSLDALGDDPPELKGTGLLQGRSTVKELREEYDQAVADRRTAVDANLDHPTKVTQVQSAAADLRAKYVAGVVRNVLQVASYHELVRTWRTAARMVGGGSLVAAVGLIMFIWAANPPAVAVKSVARPAVVGEAPLLRLTLTETGQKILARELGTDCDASKPLSVLFLSSTDSGADVVVQQQGCHNVRFLVTPSWGTVRDDPVPPVPTK